VVDEQPTHDGPPDLIQFSTPIFYCTEESGYAQVDVMRFGKCKGSCSVYYQTESFSAVAGRKYIHTEGQLHFEKGEVFKTIEIGVINDESFDTTLEFGCRLSDPKGCILGEQYTSQSSCRIQIIDDDVFPANKFREKMEESIAAQTEEVLHRVGVSILCELLKFIFLRVPSVWWKSFVVAVLDQMHNVYYMMQFFLRVYLVDVVLNVHTPGTMQNLIVPHDRWKTAVWVGAIWVAPTVLLVVIDRLKVGYLDMGRDIRRHLRVNLVRKYLNYNDASRNDIMFHEIVQAMAVDIPEVVENSYLVLFDMLRDVGKISCVAYLLLNEDVRSAVPLVIYPTVMLVVAFCRQSAFVKLAMESAAREVDTQGMLIHLSNHVELINNYNKRTVIVDKFEEFLSDQRAASRRLAAFVFWNEQLVPTMATVMVGIFIAFSARQVLSGEEGSMTLGSFVAMIGVYLDMGELFDGFYTSVRKCLEMIEPMIGVVKMINMPTETIERMERCQQRKDFLVRSVAGRNPLDDGDRLDMLADSNVVDFDKLPIAFQGVVSYLDKGFNDDKAAINAKVTVKAHQGQMILITGEHGMGKSTVLRLLSDMVTPAEGQVLSPLHLRTLHVSHNPHIIPYMTLYENLVFGNEECDRVRVCGIVKRMGFKKHTMKFFKEDLMNLDSEECKRSFKGTGGQLEWVKHLSNVELRRVHLARAFIFNPEVLVLERPIEGFERGETIAFLNMLREFVDNRGLEMEEELMHYRRPRTIFFTGSKDSVEFARKECHTVWYLGKNGINVHEGGAKEGIKVLDGGKSSLPQLGLLEDETGELTLSAEYWTSKDHFNFKK